MQVTEVIIHCLHEATADITLQSVKRGCWSFAILMTVF